ncbi:hypothetical protein TNCV_1961401 [Trichonephila clavipes]|nr:hypothetical protein TNCV_1961401 [Trichonephila clavipes]
MFRRGLLNLALAEELKRLPALKEGDTCSVHVCGSYDKWCQLKCRHRVLTMVQNYEKKRRTISPLLKICNVPIQEVKRLKTLGIIFDSNITWKTHKYLRRKGFKYLNDIKVLSSPKKGTRSDHLLNIINTTIRSLLTMEVNFFPLPAVLTDRH